MQSGNQLFNNSEQVVDILNKCVALMQSDTDYDFASVAKIIDEKVKGLLNFEKPKIMVAGIYSAGKSTIINTLCREMIAEVSARPQTDKITEYNYKDCILVDSPGVDAPIEHEEITDEYVSKCHILIFVISTGMFESNKNYSKMYEWIRTGNPFIIVVNDKVGYQDFNCDELQELKGKVLSNLRQFSGDSKIGDKYDIIVVNAKRAEKGIFKNKPKLYELSNMGCLEDRISTIMKQKNVLKLIVAPVNNLIAILDDFENFEASKIIAGFDEDMESKIYRLQSRRNSIADEVRLNIRTIIESREDMLINAAINGKDNSAAVMEDIKYEMQQLYQNKISDLMLFAKKLFKNIELNVNEELTEVDGNLSISVSVIPSDNSQPSVLCLDDSEESSDGGLVGLAGATAAAATLPKIAGITQGMPYIILIPVVMKVLDHLLGGSNDNSEEYKRLMREAEENNRRALERVDEQLRVRQEIRMQVQEGCSKLVNSFTANMVGNINNISDGIINDLMRICEENAEITAEIKGRIEQSHSLKRQLEAIKNKIV